MITLAEISLRTLAKKFPMDPPASVQRAFDEALGAIDLDPKKYRLFYVPSKAIRYAEKTAGPKVKLSIGKMGCALIRQAYVVQSDRGGLRWDREVAVHEAMHFKFGPHPWPGEPGFVGKKE